MTPSPIVTLAPPSPVVPRVLHLDRFGVELPRLEIWRVLLREGRSTQSGLMRRLALDYAVVGEALAAMLTSGTVTLQTENGTKVYTAVQPRSAA